MFTVVVLLACFLCQHFLLAAATAFMQNSVSHHADLIGFEVNDLKRGAASRIPPPLLLVRLSALV